MTTPRAIPANFTAFNGTLKADDILRTNPSLPLDTYIARVHAFINKLRDDPGTCGIPTARTTDVINIVTAFFPDLRPVSRAASSVPFPAVGLVPVRDLESPSDTNARIPDPISVPFSTVTAAKHVIQIIDAASALGYIFSIATPPEANANWNQYYLPLCVLYSRCLYLLFVRRPGDGAVKPVTELDVPTMSCVMYNSTLSPSPYVFGSTYKVIDSNNPIFDSLREPRTQMVDAWRQDLLNSAAREAGITIPTIPPRVYAKLGDYFYDDIRGEERKGQRRPALFKPLDSNSIDMYVAEYQAAYKAVNLAEKRPLDATCNLIPYTMIPSISVQNLNTTHRNLLKTLMKLAANSAPIHDIEKAFGAFAIHLYTPRMRARPVKGLPGTGEITVPPPIRPGAILSANLSPSVRTFPQWRTVLEANLWPAIRTTAMTRLYAFMSKISIYDIIQKVVPFRRCAETYGFCTLWHPSSYFHAINTAATSTITNTRGISLNTAKLGNHIFSTGLTHAEISQIKDVYRYPCDNCESLIPIYFGGMSAATYNVDVDTLPHLPDNLPH